MGMEPTPLRVDKIRRILETSSSSTHLPPYECGAADAQAVGPHMMDASRRKPWVRAAVIAGVAYVVVGYGSAVLDPSVPNGARFVWRLAAWAVSAAVFAAHIGYEHVRLGNPPRTMALHTAAAVALGAFLLAAAATVHAAMVASHAPYWRFLLALVLWPIITALPAFLAALVAGAVLARLPRRA